MKNRQDPIHRTDIDWPLLAIWGVVLGLLAGNLWPL
jgi:hypothetical protein